MVSGVGAGEGGGEMDESQKGKDEVVQGDTRDREAGKAEAKTALTTGR